MKIQIKHTAIPAILLLPIFFIGGMLVGIRIESRNPTQFPQPYAIFVQSEALAGTQSVCRNNPNCMDLVND